MESTSDRVLSLVAAGDVPVSEHGYEELVQDDILVRDWGGQAATYADVEVHRLVADAEAK